MKKNIVCLVMATLICSVFLQPLGTAQSRDGHSEYRTFTNAGGRSIQARALDVRGDQVTLARNDGRRFTVAISGLSEADQAYLRGLTKAATAAATDADWPAFRGPGAMGVSDATGLPVEWDASGVRCAATIVTGFAARATFLETKED